MSSRAAQPDTQLTVIIPTWNRAGLLARCLASLQTQTAPCRVMVVDNGSTDGTAEMVENRFPSTLLVRLPANLGFAKAVNEGLRRTESPYVALLNNDTEADPRWVEVGLRAFCDYPQYWFFASRIVHYTHRHLLDSAGDCYSRTGLPYKRGLGEPVERYSQPEPVLGASAGAAFYRRSLFDEIGLFDEDYVIYLEDVDLSLRAQLAGRPCLYLPDAVVYHIEAASDPHRGKERSDPPGLDPAREVKRGFYSPDRVYWITRNRWQLMVTYQPVRNLPFLVFGWARSGMFHLLKGGYFLSFLRGLGAGVLMTPKAIAKRLRLRGQRKLRAEQLCRLLSEC